MTAEHGSRRAGAGSSAHDAERRYEAALRRIPDAYSLALRLRGAGVADEVICGYLQIEPEGLSSVFELAHQKLAAELQKSS